MFRKLQQHFKPGCTTLQIKYQQHTQVFVARIVPLQWKLMCLMCPSPQRSDCTYVTLRSVMSDMILPCYVQEDYLHNTRCISLYKSVSKEVSHRCCGFNAELLVVCENTPHLTCSTYRLQFNNIFHQHWLLFVYTPTMIKAPIKTRIATRCHCCTKQSPRSFNQEQQSLLMFEQF